MFMGPYTEVPMVNWAGAECRNILSLLQPWFSDQLSEDSLAVTYQYSPIWSHFLGGASSNSVGNGVFDDHVPSEPQYLSPVEKGRSLIGPRNKTDMQL